MHPKGERTQKHPKDVRSLLGVFDLKDQFENGRFSSATEEIRIHPKWNPETTRYDADIALLVMDQNAPLNNYIRPICLPEQDSNILSTKSGVVVGYGLSSSYASAAENIPRLLNVPIHKNEECFLHNKELAGISSLKTFCAGSGNGSGVCLGDSGSGLYVQSNEQQYLRGIVSASLITLERSCDVDDYAIYTSVGHYYDWILGDIGWMPDSGGVCNGCIFQGKGSASTGICNGCIFDVAPELKAFVSTCNGCIIKSSGQYTRINVCNACTIEGKGSVWIGTCNGCEIKEEAGPVWIRVYNHFIGNIPNCEGCIR